MKTLRASLLVILLTAAMSAGAASADPQSRLKDADRFYRAGDTAAAIRNLRECVIDPAVKEWMIEEALKMFAARFRSPADSPAALGIFSDALRSPKASPVVSSLLAFLNDYPSLSAEEKLSALSGLTFSGQGAEVVLETRIQFLRRLGRYEPAAELAAQLAGQTGKLDHRVLVVDLYLDLSRTADAIALSQTILNEHASDASAYSLLGERFYRHGDYRTTLDIHGRARRAFSNPMMFFDQSLSICQGLQLSPEGIALYLPMLSGGMIPVPDVYRDFLAMIADVKYLTRDYPELVKGVQNPNLFLVALPRFAELASDADCQEFIRLYRQRFDNVGAHLTLAEELLPRKRLGLFVAVLNEIPDTPVDVSEAKRQLLFKNSLQSQGPDEARRQYPPASFTIPGIRASVHRLFASAFFSRWRIAESIEALKAAQQISPEASDHLRLAQMYFLSARDSEALRSAHEAHKAMPTDETLYWLGWLSFLSHDTETARSSFRDAATRSENFLADESLSWLIAMAAAKKGEHDPGDLLRSAMRGQESFEAGGNLPVAAKVTLRRIALAAGMPGKSLSAEGSAYLKYLRWKALDPKDRAEPEYQDLLRKSPEFLRSLIRTEEP